MNFKTVDLSGGYSKELKHFIMPESWDNRIMLIDGNSIMECVKNFVSNASFNYCQLRYMIYQFTNFANRNPFVMTDFTFSEIRKTVSCSPDKYSLVVGWKNVETRGGLMIVGTIAVVDVTTGTIMVEYQTPVQMTPIGTFSNITIAIDGPASAGKSTVAKRIAKDLDLVYIDTGAMYRAVGYACLTRNISCTNINEVTELLPELDIKFVNVGNGVQRLLLNDDDITDYIRTNDVSMAASAVSALTPVRQKLVDMQKEIAKKGNVIMDGRDIGTVVMPDANLKVFLTAEVETRANRRFKELCDKGDIVEYEDILEDLKTRDYNDSHRANSPLKPAFDAQILDTTKMSIDCVVLSIMQMTGDAIR